jgi:hypothetical protein
MATIDDKGLMERGSIKDACKGNTDLAIEKKPPAPESLKAKKGKK